MRHVIEVENLQLSNNMSEKEDNLVLTDFATFQKIDIRVGEIVWVENFPEARKPAFKLWINFGSELGERKSSAQITKHYSIESLIGRKVLAVINFTPRQIGKFISEVLVLGVPDLENEGVILIEPEGEALLGGRVH